MKHFSVIAFAALLLSVTPAIFAEEFDFDEAIRNLSDEDLYKMASKVRESFDPKIKGHIFLDNTLAQIKNGTNTDTEIRDEMQNTPLMWAVAFRDIEAVQFLLAHGANTEATNTEGATPFAWIALPILLFKENNPIYLDTNYMLSLIEILLAYHMDLYKPIPYCQFRLGAEASPMAIILAMVARAYHHPNHAYNNANDYEAFEKIIRYFSSKYKFTISEKTIAMAINFMKNSVFNDQFVSEEIGLETLHILKCFFEQNYRCVNSCPIN